MTGIWLLLAAMLLALLFAGLIHGSRAAALAPPQVTVPAGTSHAVPVAARPAPGAAPAGTVQGRPS